MPAFSLDSAPRTLTDPLHSPIDAPLPLLTKSEAHSFGSVLEPRYIVRAGSLDQ